LENLTVGTVKRVELRHHAKFCRNQSNRGQDLAIFRFFKMAAAAIFGFLKFETFNGRTAQERQTASPCKISLKSLKPRPRYGDFSIFKDGAAAILDF